MWAALFQCLEWPYSEELILGFLTHSKLEDMALKDGHLPISLLVLPSCSHILLIQSEGA